MPDDPTILSRENNDQFDGSCPNCGEPLGEPDTGDIHHDPGEFIAITQRCVCGLVIESFYDWDRTERKEEET